MDRTSLKVTRLAPNRVAVVFLERRNAEIVCCVVGTTVTVVSEAYPSRDTPLLTPSEREVAKTEALKEFRTVPAKPDSGVPRVRYEKGEDRYHVTLPNGSRFIFSREGRSMKEVDRRGLEGMSRAKQSKFVSEARKAAKGMARVRDRGTKVLAMS